MKLTCPSKNRLREFLEGSISDADADQISDHVEGCSSCDHVLTDLESDQSDLLQELREGFRTESLLREPEFERLRDTARFSQADTTAPSEVDEYPVAGKRLRDYRLVNKIGEGGMGTVYQAVHVHLAKHVALKILPADKLQSGQSVKRFRQEMRAVGQVNHPNVVSASDAGTIDGQHFLVMELVQGADLARIIHERGPLNVADACEIVRQAAIGLQHAHDTGLVHRDVKPSNIMLALDGSVKLLDLGLAGLNNTDFQSTANVVVTDHLTSVGQIMGTLDYMAPEQITASPEVDGRADIYALGATLFQLLTGRTPCGDRSEGTPERIEAVLHKPPLEIAQLRSDVPEELCALLLKMLAKNPEDRPKSASDVASELKHSSSDADLVALAEECRTSIDMPSADVDVTDDVSFVVSGNTQPHGEGTSRRPFTAVALAGFFLTLVAAVAYYIQTNNGIVRIEVNDPSLKVAITGQTITMTEGSKMPLVIRAGEQSLIVRQGDSDFEFETDRFQIRRGDKIAFKVERLNGEVAISRNGEPFGGVKLPEPNDHQGIQGLWQVVSARQDDVVNVGMDASLTVDGHAFTLSFRGPTGAIVDERAGKIEIDDTKNPKRIDFFDSKVNGKDLIGIYKREGDILTICVGEVHERKRPRDFKWPQGPGIMRMECQRRQKEGGMDIHTPGVREAALRTSSHNNMKHITFALLDYYKAKQQWPDKLDALLPFLEVGKSVFENPLTGDNPGYDYVKPTAPLERIAASETIVLYQLRDGQRDRQLARAYLDGQVSTTRLLEGQAASPSASSVELAKAHTKLFELRTRYEVQHPAIRSQLQIIAELERQAKRWGSNSPENLSPTKLFEIKEQNKHLVHIQELDCPLPASWQYRIYIPSEKSGPLFRFVTGVCEDGLFTDDNLSVTASVPVPLAREQFVLNIAIRRANDGEYKCYAYIVGPKNADFHEIALPVVEDLKLLTDPREKYFETGKRVMANGARHQEVKLYQPGAVIPLVLLKTDEKSVGEDSAKTAESFPAIWLRLKIPEAPKDSSTAIHGDQQKTLPESSETDYTLGVVYWEPDGPKRIDSTVPEKIESRKQINSAWQSVKDGDVKAATDAYLKALSIDPYLLKIFKEVPGRNVVEVFQRANRLPELGECIDETGLKRRIYEPSLTRETIRNLLSDTKTRDLGHRVLRNYFRIHHRGRYSVLTSSEDFGIIWEDVPDLIYFLRVLLIPTDFEKEGAGWERYSVLRVGDREEASGPLSSANVLFCDKDVLRTFKNEVYALTEKNPGWKGGLVLLASVEAELGNFDQSLAIINEHFIGPTAPVIPVSTAWVLGLALEGKSHDLDQIVIRLYEYSLRKVVLNLDSLGGIDPLRFSPLNELARLYAKYGRKKEARQLLYGLVDASDQHPLVQGYTPSVFNVCNYGPSRSCIECHRTEMNLPDYVMMSDVMTDIGHPVDSLISLARIDASFGNAFTSSDGWIGQKRLMRLAKEAELPTAKYRRYSLPLQKKRAEQAVTPRSVIDALELGTFETKRRYSQQTYDQIRSRHGLRDPLDFLVWRRTLKPERKPGGEIDLMLSVRGEGPDAQATVFSPVVDILKLAVESKATNAAKDIAELDKRLVTQSEQHPKDIEAGIAATVFAFLRKDLDSAKDRLTRLQSITDYPKSDGAAFWLVARHALKHDETRILGAVLAERALTGAETLPDARFKEAISQERSGIRAI